MSSSPIYRQVSDATSPGMGTFAGHFIQSSSKGADGLKSALSEMIAYNFLGVTFVGPNICTRGCCALRLIIVIYLRSICLLISILKCFL